jgi:hypothetical protein
VRWISSSRCHRLRASLRRKPSILMRVEVEGGWIHRRMGRGELSLLERMEEGRWAVAGVNDPWVLYQVLPATRDGVDKVSLSSIRWAREKAWGQTCRHFFRFLLPLDLLATSTRSGVHVKFFAITPSTALGHGV